MELPRGMKDIESEEFEKIEFVKEKFQETAKLYDFKFFDPSPIELLSTLETKSGPSIKDEIYYFQDKGEREVALRFDFTMGITRYIATQKSIKLPAKLSSFGGVFRYDEPQRGRYRFFHQWNVEIFGKQSRETDAELIEFTSHLFSKLRIENIIIEFSNRKLIQSFVTSIFPSTDRNLVSEVFRAMDKVSKKRKEEILNEYNKKGIDPKKLEKILEFSQIKGTPTEIESKVDTSKIEGWTDLVDLYDVLKNRHVNNTRINFGIVRGLDYYSDFVFEVFDPDSNLGALAGGGRYDTLPKAFGREDIGAAGVAGGIERIIFSLEKRGLLKSQKNLTVSVLYANEDMQKEAISLASRLRQKGIPINIDLIGKPLKKQMEQATHSEFAIILAPREFSENKIILKNMIERNEKQLKIDDLLKSAESILVAKRHE